MAVGLKVGPIFYRIGTGSFLYSFFSTIAYHLEEMKWGTRFPFLMKDLYNGKLSQENISELVSELEIIKAELQHFKPEEIIWNFDDLSQMPPWGNNIAPSINSLSNYFLTSDGKDIFDVFKKSTDTAKEVNKDLELKSL